MKKLLLDLSNLGALFKEALPEEKVAAAQTSFLKQVSEKMHAFYRGKMQTLPKAGIYGFNWFNVWYTPGVSKVSTTIRDHPDASYQLSNRGNLVAVVSDSTRVLGDGDCGPSGGLGVMEGKAMLMKYLGACDAIALCVDNRNKEGKPDAQKLIDFVKMLQPSVGAVNLEDISQPNCYRVLDELRESCDIPIWHDDAQGTACVTLAGVINALKLTNRKISSTRVVLYGCGAANSTIASFLLQSGLDPAKLIIFDSKGGLHIDRQDIRDNKDKYRQWALAEKTNPQKLNTMEEAMKGADLLIALSTPGPGTILPEWIQLMAKDAIVFACANPVPEIYPYDAHKAGALIVATGRGDFPNQVNNSVGFPGILKGVLMVQARKISDGMAIAAAHSLADFAEKRGISAQSIIPTMDETEVFAQVAADVAVQAMKEGLARVQMSHQEVYDQALKEITETRALCQSMMEAGHIQAPPPELLQEVFEACITESKSS
ncbi:MAG: NADP-dependent malic enzyme [Candidatus Cloacimonadaceae bacterium]|jgi:malate dehydrogenase (oxaloacetate-decarboxylating)|nr:NADP-dependent malic enzyme [Candidatus Cloacimonadaceae bacterium]